MDRLNAVSDAPFQPIRILQVELSRPLPDFAPTRSDAGTPYAQAMLLVRLHGYPLSIIELTLDGGGICAVDYAPIIWEKLGSEINAHLAQHGATPLTALPLTGIASEAGACACIEAQQIALENAPFVSVIIPTRERAHQLERCLRSFKNLIYPHFEILIVDNQPRTNATADVVERLCIEQPYLRYICEDRRGVSAARNRGICEAAGKILAFMDDDAVVDPYWLIELVRGFAMGERVGCVTGLVVPIELETPAQLLFERYCGFNRGYKQRIFDLQANRFDNPFYPYSIGHCGTGASMAFTREAAVLIGGQDPVLGAGSLALAGGDIDSFFQVVTKGYQLVYNPASIALHEHRRSYETLRRQIYNYGVGLTAFFTKCLLTDLRRIPDFLRRIPFGVYTLLSSNSSMNARRGLDYPGDLKVAERKGMLLGPFAYLRSRWYVRGENRRFPNAPSLSMTRGLES